SSVTDLANSLTGDMVMLSPGSEDDDGEGPISEKLGRIQFSIGYSFQNTTLTVKVLRGQELPAKDFSGTSDPFVKIYLLPDKKHKLETKVKRKNLNPHWNETFLFEGFPYEKVRERTLYLQVLDYDRFSRNDPIGEVSIPLNKVELGQIKTFWKELKPCSDGSVRAEPIITRLRGDLLVSLCYNPTANTITVNIIKARNLKAMDIGGTSDPYVKVWLMHKDKRVEKKKTVTMKRCLNPVFNESFPFDVPAHVLRETTIIITVMDKDRLSRNDVIGKANLPIMEERAWGGEALEGHARSAAHQRRPVARSQGLISPQPPSVPPLPPSPHPYAQDLLPGCETRVQLAICSLKPLKSFLFSCHNLRSSPPLHPVTSPLSVRPPVCTSARPSALCPFP
ncbi:unnamed protein product, partial [Tetraodon nigroviridis]